MPARRRETLVVAALLAVLAVAAFGAHLRPGGFYNDDWSFLITARYPPDDTFARRGAQLRLALVPPPADALLAVRLPRAGHRSRAFMRPGWSPSGSSWPILVFVLLRTLRVPAAACRPHGRVSRSCCPSPTPPASGRPRERTSSPWRAISAALILGFAQPARRSVATGELASAGRRAVRRQHPALRDRCVADRRDRAALRRRRRSPGRSPVGDRRRGRGHAARPGHVTAPSTSPLSLGDQVEHADQDRPPGPRTLLAVTFWAPATPSSAGSRRRARGRRGDPRRRRARSRGARTATPRIPPALRELARARGLGAALATGVAYAHDRPVGLAGSEQAWASATAATCSPASPWSSSPTP